MRINVKHNFDLNKVKVRLDRRIPRMINEAAGIIIRDIEYEGIDKGKDLDGKPFKKLKPATIKAKRKKGSAQPNKPLYDTGTMKFTYPKQRATISNPTAIIQVANKRSRAITGYSGGIGQLQHEGNKNIPARPWLGVSKRAEKRIKKNLRLNISKALGKEWRLN